MPPRLFPRRAGTGQGLLPRSVGQAGWRLLPSLDRSIHPVFPLTYIRPYLYMAMRMYYAFQSNPSTSLPPPFHPRDGSDVWRSVFADTGPENGRKRHVAGVSHRHGGVDGSEPSSFSGAVSGSKVN